MRERYVEQVRLLMRLLLGIAAEEAFALKGGSAINLFYRDMRVKLLRAKTLGKASDYGAAIGTVKAEEEVIDAFGFVQSGGARQKSAPLV